MFSLQALALLSVVVISVSADECRESFMTICNSFEDFKQYKNTEELTQLMIGSEKEPANMTSVDLMKVLRLGDYHKLTSITVIRAVNHLHSTYGYQCTYERSPLQLLTFYGNVLKQIEPYHFPVLTIEKMSLVNNRIEAMKPWAFRSHGTRNIDLSDNLLDVIESESLPLQGTTKVITIRRNRLTHIEPGSFDPSLENLNLDDNRLRYIQNDVLENLVNLKELTLSHNSLNKIPKIEHMTKLIVFDISHNAITTIEPSTFKKMDDLKLVDLSHNAISSESVVQWLNVPDKQPGLIISLALNRLKDLNLENVQLQKQKLVLYGNPWDCNSFPDLQKRLRGHESECDLEFLSKGDVPYCINYRSGGYPFVSLWEQDIDKFRETVKESEKNSSCKLAPGKYMWLHPIPFGCVA